MVYLPSLGQEKLITAPDIQSPPDTYPDSRASSRHQDETYYAWVPHRDGYVSPLHSRPDTTLLFHGDPLLRPEFAPPLAPASLAKHTTVLLPPTLPAVPRRSRSPL